jgi:hypothetical protein
MIYTLEQLFARMCQLQPDMLRGRDSESKWSERRFSFEIHSNGLGTWTVTVQDMAKVMMAEWKPGNELTVAVNADPRAAIEQALATMGLLAGISH